ncbi:helix-turn-helix domain-containing protein [Candidatus Deferrimicrobium sp.]|uniref:helix-turn-helix domain-containing protein n=1 Tax=Candidatus Deferrimicrobium sp. TaxID=3060586 RepID=UPI0039C86D19
MPYLLTTNEVARRLSVVPLTIYRLTKRGLLRPRRIGRLLRFEEADVERFLREETTHGLGKGDAA